MTLPKETYDNVLQACLDEKDRREKLRSSPREPGYYWVRYDLPASNGWIVAMWNMDGAGDWFIPFGRTNAIAVDDNDLIEIDERRIERLP